MQPTPPTEVGRLAPLLGGAFYLNFISAYGTAIVTTLAICYGALQIVLRLIEHRKIMKEKADVSN